MRSGKWLLFLLGFCVAGLFAGELTEEVTKKIEARPGMKIDIRNTNGTINVRNGSNDVVTVLAKIKVKSGSRKEAKRIMEKVEIVAQKENGVIRIGPKYPKQRGKGFWDWLSGRKASVTVSLDVEVPEEVDLRINSVNGRVIVRNVRGEIEAGTTNGGLELESVSGRINAHTTNGGIRVRVDDWSASDELECRTTNGGVSVSLPSGIAADFSAKTTNGSVHTDFPIAMSGTLSKKKIQGTINGGGGDVRLSTVNGSIHIEEE